jgi:hypothetical protein
MNTQDFDLSRALSASTSRLSLQKLPLSHSPPQKLNNFVLKSRVSHFSQSHKLVVKIEDPTNDIQKHVRFVSPRNGLDAVLPITLFNWRSPLNEDPPATP